MATMNVKDAAGSTVAVEKPNANGRAAAAASRPIALSTEDKAALDLLATATKQDETIAAINALAGSEYEAVPASTADAICGATGGVGDYIGGVLVTPTTKSPGPVSIKDGSSGTPIPLFAGGADSISTLHPFFIPLGIRCSAAGWRLTTGANLTALPVGNFT